MVFGVGEDLVGVLVEGNVGDGVVVLGEGLDRFEGFGVVDD